MSSKIAIVGAGPVGGILAAQLIKHGQDVTLIDILKPHMEKIRSEGLRIRGLEPEKTRISSTYLSIAQAHQAAQRFDRVFVCVKATAVQFVASELDLILTEDGIVISFQNGLDSELALLAQFGSERVLRGVVNYAGNIVDSGVLCRTFFNPPNYFGAADPASVPACEYARGVADLLTQAGLQSEFSPDIRWHVWEKAIRNAALMPVSALTGQNMAQVMGYQPSLLIVRNLLSEAIEIAAAVGLEFDQEFFDETLEYYRKAGTHMPSMRGDVEEGCQTEIEFLNHKIAEYGEKNGIECPYNKVLADLVLCVDQVARECRE